MKKLSMIIFAAVGTVIFFNSCSINNNNTNPQLGFVLFANVSPDAPPLTVNLNGTPLPSTLSYGYSQGYFQATPGDYNISVFSSSSSPLIENSITIAASTAYSYFVIDSLSKIKSSLVQDVLNTTSSDSVYIRFFNFSPNAGGLSLVNAANDSIFYSSRFFNDVSSSAFVRIKQGIYNLELRLGDSTVATRPLDTLAGTRTYTIFAKGNLGGTGDQALGIGNIINN